MTDHLARANRELLAVVKHMGSVGDLPDLPALAELQDRMTRAVADAVARLHDECGYSWTEIGAELGVSRQAARQRFADKAGLSAHARGSGPTP